MIFFGSLSPATITSKMRAVFKVDSRFLSVGTNGKLLCNFWKEVHEWLLHAEK